MFLVFNYAQNAVATILCNAVTVKGTFVAEVIYLF